MILDVCKFYSLQTTTSAKQVEIPVTRMRDASIPPVLTNAFVNQDTLEMASLVKVSPKRDMPGRIAFESIYQSAGFKIVTLSKVHFLHFVSFRQTVIIRSYGFEN